MKSFTKYIYIGHLSSGKPNSKLYQLGINFSSVYERESCQSREIYKLLSVEPANTNKKLAKLRLKPGKTRYRSASSL